jgi:hypothetical protein
VVNRRCSARLQKNILYRAGPPLPLSTLTVNHCRAVVVVVVVVVVVFADQTKPPPLQRLQQHYHVKKVGFNSNACWKWKIRFLMIMMMICRCRALLKAQKNGVCLHACLARVNALMSSFLCSRVVVILLLSWLAVEFPSLTS